MSLIEAENCASCANGPHVVMTKFVVSFVETVTTPAFHLSYIQVHSYSKDNATAVAKAFLEQEYGEHNYEIRSVK